jgi:hypothetical protein
LLQYFNDVHTTAKTVIKFINNHHHTLAAFREVSRLVLLKPGDTRFATNSIALDRMAEVKGPLQQMAVSDRWDEVVGGMSATDQALAAEVKDIILERNFWELLEKVGWGYSKRIQQQQQQQHRRRQQQQQRWRQRQHQQRQQKQQWWRR